MTDAWQRVRQLEGKTLLTPARSKPFRIVRVMGDRVEFVPVNGNGTVRWFPRADLEHIARQVVGLTAKEIQPRVRQEWPDDQNTSYVAAILREITST